MVDRADVTSVLAEMRSMRSQMMQQQQQVQAPEQVEQLRQSEQVGQTERSSFGETLNSAINSVNDIQQESATLAEAYERGDPNVDITRVMVAGQKSEVAFQSMVQVRNRVVQAYEEIMNMPI